MTAPSTAPPLAPAVPLFRNRQFLTLWLAGAFAGTARWLETLVIAVFAFEITGSAFWVSAMLMLRVLPMALFGMFGAVLSHRFDRRRLLMIALGVSCGVSAGLSVLASTGELQIWHVGTCAFVAGAVWMLDFPARRTLLGEVAGPGRTGSAMSLDIVAGSATRALGPVAGGALYALVEITGAFAISAMLFFLAIVGLALLQTRDQRPQSATAPGTELKQTLRKQVFSGFQIVRHDDKLKGIFAITIVFNIWGFPFTSLIPVFGAEVLSLGSFHIGLLASTEGIGALIGALFLATVVRNRHHDHFYVWGVVSYLILMLAFSASDNVAASATLLLSIGIASAAFAAMQSALVLLNAPPQGREQLMGVLSVCIGTGPIGFIHIGLLADWLGTTLATTIVAIEGIVAMTLVTYHYRHALFRATKEQVLT